MRISNIVAVGAWTGSVASAFVVGTVVVGWSPSPLIIAAQGVLPAVMVGALAVAAVAASRQWWTCGGIALAAVFVGSALILPGTRPATVPAWAESAPQLTVFASNVLMSNPDPDAGLAAAVQSDADVIVLSEMIPRFEPALERSGLLDRYDTVVRAGSGNVLLTRLPVSDSAVLRRQGMSMPSATVVVGEREVLVIGVHTLAPHSFDSVDTWNEHFEGVAQAASEAEDVVAVGDFNAGPWNAPFRRLLDWGFVDAHRALGHGLSRTWGPRHLGLDGAVRLLGLDHSVSRGALAPVSVADVDVAGSDHRGVAVTYAVR